MTEDTAQKTNESSSIFIRDVARVDCAIFDPSRGIVGQSWHLDVEVSGHVDENFFVYDFSHLKKLVKNVAKTSIDHALLIPVSGQMVNFIESPNGEKWELVSSSKFSKKSQWNYLCPQGAVFPMRAIVLKPSIIEQEFNRLLRHRLSESIIGVKIKLREEASEPSTAFFRYTHGIEGHDGLCQRLFHGHRSRIEVEVGGERRPDLEHYLCREVLGSEVHIATPSQVTNGKIACGTRGTEGEMIELEYRSSLGLYYATLPASKVFMIDHETSIESLTNQLAQLVRKKIGSLEKVQVRCFEGIDKGAVVEL